MTFLLADLLSPTPQLPKAAGVVLSAPESGDGGEFAQALAAFRAGALETKTGEAGTVISLGDGAAPVPELVPPPAEVVIGLDNALLPVSDVAQPVIAPVPVAVGTAPAPVATGLETAAGGIAPDTDLIEGALEGEDAPKADTPLDGANLIVAAPVVPVVPIAVTDVATEELALKIAAAAQASTPDLPDVPVLPTQPVLPQAPEATDGDAPLLEGRASASTPPPVIATGASAPALPKETLAAIAPRAVVTPETETSAKPVPTPAPAPAPQQAQTPAAAVPAALQAVAANPNVVSVQAKAMADDTQIDTTDANTSPAKPAPSTAAPRTADVAAPATTPVAMPAEAPEILVAAPELAADPDINAKAADGALAVLTKDKAEAAPVKPAAPTQTEADIAASKNGAAAAAIAGAPASDVKPVETKAPADAAASPEKPIPADKPVAADKTAAAPDARSAQVPTNDKPALADVAARSVQQASNLPAVAIPHIASEIASKFKRGATRFEIRLDPPELGRIDVRIDVDKEGRVTSRLMVEKSETLDLLKADQRALERALHDAGFKSDQNGLSFSLRDDRGGQAKFEEQHLLREQFESAATEEEPVRIVAETAYRTASRGPGGFDFRV